MKDNKEQTKTTIKGVGFTGLLTIAFIVLKLCGVINWSWFWVLSPIIFSTGVGLIIILICAVLYFIASVLEEMID